MRRLSIFVFSLLGIYFSFMSFVSAGCSYNPIGFYECVEDRNIALIENIKGEVENSEISLDVGKIDMPPPSECIKEYCYEETSVVVTIRKTWKPLLAVINNDKMTPWEFANKFNNLQETGFITNNSPILERAITQKVLYERGLMGTEPTGKLGYLTELAVMRLQCIKGYSEYNVSKAVFEIGPKTIKEINNLKERMKEKDYLKNTWFPPVDLSKCGSEFSKRQTAIEGLLKSPPTRADNKYISNVIIDPSLIWDGVVSLKKAE